MKGKRVLMLLENSVYPHDPRVLAEATALTGDGYEVTVICPALSGQPLGRRVSARQDHAATIGAKFGHGIEPRRRIVGRIGQDGPVHAPARDHVAVLRTGQDMDLDALSVEGTSERQAAIVGLQDDRARQGRTRRSPRLRTHPASRSPVRDPCRGRRISRVTCLPPPAGCTIRHLDHDDPRLLTPRYRGRADGAKPGLQRRRCGPHC